MRPELTQPPGELVRRAVVCAKLDTAAQPGIIHVSAHVLQAASAAAPLGRGAQFWLARLRRLARDYERLPETLVGLHYVASAMLMLTWVLLRAI